MAEPVDSSSNYLQLDSLPIVDLNSLSQSELNALSLCSNDAFDFRHCDDLVIPKIDRSVFNESAGSRKQTYSRLRLAPRQSEIATPGHGSRGARVHVVSKTSMNDAERKENDEQIVNVLRRLLGRADPEIDLTAVTGERRGRKRGRKRKDGGLGGGDRVLEIVKPKSPDFDVATLASVEGPFSPELRRRTVGLETEAELLGFLGRLEGRWGSQRKKRKIVDASDFGDHLPQGWKLLLGLKRKQGRVSLYCRRYMSSNGQQFASWRDVSSYFISIGPQNSHLLNSCHSNVDGLRPDELASGSISGLTPKIGNKEDVIRCSASMEVTSLNVENLADIEVSDILECHKCNVSFHEKDAYLQHLQLHHESAEFSSLGKSIYDCVIIRDGEYECPICHTIFFERHYFDKHFRRHVRSSVKSDEALSCQMNGEKSIDSSSMSGVRSGLSKVYEPLDSNKNSNFQIAISKHGDKNNDGLQCTPHVDSFPGTSTDKFNHKLDVVSPCVQDKRHSIPQTYTMKLNHQQSLDSNNKMEAGSIVRISTKSNFQLNTDSPCGKQGASPINDKETSIESSFDKQFSGCEITDNRSGEYDKFNNDMDVKFTSFLDSAPTFLSNNEETNASKTSDGKGILESTTDGLNKSSLVQEAGCEHFLPESANDPIDGVTICVNRVLSMDASKSQLNNIKILSCEPESALGDIHSKLDTKETDRRNDEKHVHGTLVADASSPQIQLPACFASHHMDVGKGQDNFCNANQKPRNLSAAEELRMDDKVPSKTSSSHASRSLPEEPMPMDSAYNTDPEEGLENPAKFDSEGVLPKMAGMKQVSCMCIWCGIEFDLEAVKPEIRSDSVGSLCPMCKAKFSGQLNLFDNGLATNPDQP